MKTQIFRKLQRSPRLTRKDLLLTLLPVLLWALAIYARPYVISPYCAQRPNLCTSSNVNFVDQSSLGLERSDADGFSYFTQNLSGIFAFTVPGLWNGTLVMIGRISPFVALTQTAVDLTIIAQTSAWNGLFTESAHLLSQRPRPFVYNRPEEGKNFSNYTSFYSGHTSFSAASTTALFLTLLGRHAPTPLLILVATLAQTLILSTAFFRILAGRHFITDVLAGALAGALIALIIALIHRSSEKRHLDC